MHLILLLISQAVNRMAAVLDGTWLTLWYNIELSKNPPEKETLL